MIRRLALALVVLLSFVPVRAAVRMEGFGTFLLQDDFPGQYGVGVGASRALARGTSLYFRGAVATGWEHRGEPNEMVYGAFMGLAGLRFRAPISGTEFFWTASTALGGTFTYRQQAKRYGPYTDPSETETVYDLGPTAGAWLGAEYRYTPRVGFFLDAGYLHSFYFDEFKDDTVGGLSVICGVSYRVRTTPQARRDRQVYEYR